MSRNFVLSAALLLAGLSGNAFAQAAAESALAHSASGTAASKLSSDIGNTVTQGINHVSDRIQQQLKQSPQSTPPAKPKAYTFTNPAPKHPAVSPAPAGQMAPTNTTGQAGIASIQGGIQCSPSTAGNCQVPTKRANDAHTSVIKLGKQ